MSIHSSTCTSTSISLGTLASRPGSLGSLGGQMPQSTGSFERLSSVSNSKVKGCLRWLIRRSIPAGALWVAVSASAQTRRREPGSALGVIPHCAGHVVKNQYIDVPREEFVNIFPLGVNVHGAVRYRHPHRQALSTRFERNTPSSENGSQVARHLVFSSGQCNGLFSGVGRR